MQKSVQSCCAVHIKSPARARNVTNAEDGIFGYGKRTLETTLADVRYSVTNSGQYVSIVFRLIAAVRIEIGRRPQNQAPL